MWSRDYKTGETDRPQNMAIHILPTTACYSLLQEEIEQFKSVVGIKSYWNEWDHSWNNWFRGWVKKNLEKQYAKIQ